MARVLQDIATDLSDAALERARLIDAVESITAAAIGPVTITPPGQKPQEIDISSEAADAIRFEMIKGAQAVLAEVTALCAVLVEEAGKALAE